MKVSYYYILKSQTTSEKALLQLVITFLFACTLTHVPLATKCCSECHFLSIISPYLPQMSKKKKTSSSSSLQHLMSIFYLFTNLPVSPSGT